MPVIKSAKKKLRADNKKETANKKLRNILNSLIKKAERTPSEKNIREAVRIVDKSAKKNIIHKNKAAKLKSRLSKLLGKKPKPTSKTKSKKSPSTLKNALTKR